MDRHTMHIPRDPGQTIPSFRELDEELKANSLEEYKHCASASPNPYPPYPARGWRIPPDPSHNVCIIHLYLLTTV